MYLLGASYFVVLTCMHIDTIAYCNCFDFSLAYLVKKKHVYPLSTVRIFVLLNLLCRFHVLIGGGGLSPIFILLLFLIVISFHNDNTPMQYTAIFTALKNQRTNGLVNAHLIFRPTVSTKTNKISKSQPRVIIYITL